MSTSVDQSTHRAAPAVWLVLATTLAVGTAIKLGCTSGGLVAGELGVPGCYSDVVGIFQARGLSADPVPYRQVQTEYPPGTALQWWLAMQLSSTAVGFLAVTAVVSVAATVAGVAVLARLGASDRRLLLLAASPTVLLGTLVNWDPLPVALMLGGLVAHRRGRDAIAGALLGLGGLAKLFPLVLVPLLRRPAPSRGRWLLPLSAVLTVAGGALVTVAAVAPAAAADLLAWVDLNATRPADWDTLWYLAAVVTDRAVPVPVVTVLATAAVVLGWSVTAWRGRRLALADRWVLTLPVLGWLLLAGKVWSPQHSLWLLPLVVLLAPRDRQVAAFVATDALVWLTRFPFLAGLQGLDPSLPVWPFAIAVALRAATLLWIVLTPPDRLGATA